MSKQFTSKNLNICFVKLVLVLKISASYSCGWYLQDNWIAHQDDFNQLLAELNSCHGQGETGRFMLGSIRCWKLSRVSILCLKEVPEAQFVMQIIFLVRLSIPPSSSPKSLGAKGCVAIHDHGFVDLSGSVLLSGLKGFCWGKKTKC